MWTLGKKKWTLKKSDQLSPIPFPASVQSPLLTETMGKEEEEKERDSTAKNSCRSVKEAPPQLTFLWCWGGAGKLHLYNINFNPCTPEGVPAQIAYFLHSIYFNPCTPEGATV